MVIRVRMSVSCTAVGAKGGGAHTIEMHCECINLVRLAFMESFPIYKIC